MPSPRPSSQRINREKSMSFHGKGSAVAGGATGLLRRPKTLPNLPTVASTAQTEGKPKMTKFLLNVTIQGSLGPVHVLVAADSTVGDLITAAVRLYVKEGRRPVLPASDPAAYDLHYSQFSLESLKRDEKVADLGSRNFFLCRRRADAESGYSVSPSGCGKQAEEKGRTAGFGLPWMKLLGFLQ